MTRRQKHVKHAIDYLVRFMATYSKQMGYLDYSDDTIIKDVIYGLGVALGGKQHMYASGFEKFRGRLSQILADVRITRKTGDTRWKDALREATKQYALDVAWHIGHGGKLFDLDKELDAIIDMAENPVKFPHGLCKCGKPAEWIGMCDECFLAGGSCGSITRPKGEKI